MTTIPHCYLLHADSVRFLSLFIYLYLYLSSSVCIY